MIIRILLVLILSVLSGCSDPVARLIDEKFPPVDMEDQRTQSINSAADALSIMPIPNIGANVLLENIGQQLLTDDVKANGVSSIKLQGEDQLLRIELQIDRTFTEIDAGEDAALAEVLKRLKPHLTGKLILYAGFALSLSSSEQNAPRLDVKLLPHFQSLTIEKAVFAEQIDAKVVIDPIVALVNRYVDNISGELSRLPVTRTSLPAMVSVADDISEVIKINNSGADATVELIANPIASNFKLIAAAVFVQDTHLSMLAQIAPESSEASTDSRTISIEKTIDGIGDRFSEIAEQVFGMEDWTDTNWIAVRKDLIALTVNNLVSQAGVCVSASGSIPKQHTSSKIELPDGLGIDCSSDRNCNSNRECSYSQSHDTRDCSACILRAPRACAFGGCWGGHCIQTGNDLICEAAKAAQNVIYVADANLRKADCDRLKAMETAACEVEKAGEKLLCETKKEALNRLAATGNFANIDIDYSASSSDLKVCLRNFQLSPAIDRVQFELDVTGEANANVNVSFVPLDIVGHLTCAFPWSQEKNFTASLRDSRVGIGSTVNIATNQSSATANFALEDVSVKAKLSPGITEYLLTSPEMLVKCPVIAGIAPTTILLTPFVPVLRGEIDYTLSGQNVSVDLALPEQNVGGRTMAFRIRADKDAIVGISTQP